MSADIRPPDRKGWTRPSPAVTGPDRSFGGYYRTSDRKLGPEHFRGVPLQTVEDTATAAVRLGYQIVDAQISRGLDMARRLRGAADRAGVGADGEDALDSAEKLLSRGALLALEWLESAANEPGSPLTRLVTAEYRLVGSLLGLKVDGSSERTGPAAPPPPPEPVSAKRPRQESTPATAAGRPVRVRHAADSERRAVSVVHWQLDATVRPSAAPRHLRFHPTSSIGNVFLDGTLTLADKASPILEVTTRADQPPGRWRAAICENDGEQVGIIDIVL